MKNDIYRVTDTAEREVDGELTADTPVSRRSLLKAMSISSLPGKLSLASAALFAGIAAWRTEPAFGWAWNCCNLASQQWCGCQGCNCGHYWRVWYCCYGSPSRLYGCGECQSNNTDCQHGATYYCSYGWLAFNDC